MVSNLDNELVHLSFDYIRIVNFSSSGNIGFNYTKDPCIKDKVACANREEFLSWDGVHPTQAVNRIIASEVFNGKGTVSSMNVADLIKAHTS